MDPSGWNRWPRTRKVLTTGHLSRSSGALRKPVAAMQLREEGLIRNAHLDLSWSSKSSRIPMAPDMVPDALKRLSTQVQIQKTSRPAWEPFSLQNKCLSAIVASTGIRPRDPATLLPVDPPTLRFEIRASGNARHPIRNASNDESEQYLQCHVNKTNIN